MEAADGKGEEMSRNRVVVAGGGVAALEAALALRDLAGEDLVEVDLFSPRRDFVYRPYAVGEPYGAGAVAHYDLERLADLCGAGFHLDSIAAVEHEERVAVTHDGERHPYDFMLLASGSQPLWPVPGAITFWGIGDETAVHLVTEKLLRGEIRSMAFTLPGIDSWALPVYELALLAERSLEQAGVSGVRLMVVTPEEAPLGVFGRRAGEQVAALLAERGIEVFTSTRPVRFEGGRLTVVPQGEIEVEAVVSLPRLEGRRIRGVLHDENGFVRVDEHCRVPGRERLYAAGDVTAFPVKQGGIATQQADVAAEAIAAEVGAAVEPKPFDPVLRGVLWTGAEPRYLQGWLEGGHGEASGLTARAPWPLQEGKIVGRYLTPFLAGAGATAREAAGREAA